MGLVSAVGSGIGAIGMGVGKLGFHAGKGIWNAGAGGKGAIIGGLGGGIYGAASAPDNYDFGDTMMRGLKGAGIGAIGGAVGGAVLGRGISKARGALKGMGAGAGKAAGVPISPLEARLVTNPAARNKAKVIAGAQKLFRQQQKNPLAWEMGRRGSLGSRFKGAMGSAINRAKNYKRQWMSNHRSNQVYKNARKMLPAARKDKWVNEANKYLPNPAWGATPSGGSSVTRSPIRSISGEPMVGSVDEARWAGRKAQIQAGAPMARPMAPNNAASRGYAAAGNPDALTPADNARWANRRAAQADMISPADDARWFNKKRAFTSQRGNSLSNFAAGQYGPSRSDALESYAANLGEDASIVRMMLGF